MSDQAYNSNNFNDDFEKVEPDNYGAADQDESITSSSMQGDHMAEEDRYPTNETDLLGDFSVGGSMASSEKSSEVPPPSQPLISFGDNSPESTVTESVPAKSEPTEPKRETTAAPSEGLMGIPGMEMMSCWMKTVDPRDEDSAMSDPTVTTMEEPPASNDTAELSAATTAGPEAGEVNGSQIKSETDVLDAENGIESSDESSEDESSSSANDSESSDSDVESSENEGTYDIDNPPDQADIPEQTVDIETKMDVASPEFEDMGDENKYIENVNEDEIEPENSEHQSSESSAFVEQISETISDFEDEMMPESISQTVLGNSAGIGTDNEASKDEELISSEKSFLGDIENQETCVNESQLNISSANYTSEKDSVPENESDEEDHVIMSPNSNLEETVDNVLLAESAVTDTALAKDEEGSVSLKVNETCAVEITESKDVEEQSDLKSMGDQTENTSHVIEEGKVSEYRPMGLSEEEMSNILDKLTSEQEECLESVEKDEYLDDIESPVFEKKSDLELDSSGGNSSEESADNSEQEDGDSSIDSDISGDEAGFGVWNPSPLHDDNLESLTEEDMQEFSTDHITDASVLSGYKYLETTDDANSTSGQDSYTIQYDHADPSPVQPSILVNPLEKNRELSTELGDQCHVKFQNPTNTIFYDPESPVIERVSVQVTDDLIDYDDEAKDVEQVKESVVPEAAEEMESDIDKNPSNFSLYKPKNEHDEEIKGAMELIKDTGLEELTLLASQMSMGVANKLKDDATADKDMAVECEVGTQDPDVAEVVLRRKNVKNVSDEYEESNRDALSSMIIHDIEGMADPTAEADRDAVNRMIIDDVEGIADPTTESDKYKVSSMIIHDIEGMAEPTAEAERDAVSSMIIDDIEGIADPTAESDKYAVSSMLIHDNEGVAEPTLESDRDAVSSMIVHDIEEIVEPITEKAEQKTIESEPDTPMRRPDESVVSHKEDTHASEIMDNFNADLTETSETENIALENYEEEAESSTSTVSREGTEIIEKAFESPGINNVVEGSGDYPMEQIENLASEIAHNIINGIAEEFPNEYEYNGDKFDKLTSEASEIEEINDSVTCFNTSLQNTVVETSLAEDKSQLDERTDESVSADEGAELSKVTSSTTTMETVDQDKVEEDKQMETVPTGIKAEDAAHTAVQKKEVQSSFRKRAAAMLLCSTREVLEIIYWRDVKTTGVVFGSMMFVLLSLSLCSLMSVLAYLSLAILTVTFSFRVYKSVMQAVQKSNDGHPFKKLLDLDIQLREDAVQAAAQKIADNINNCSAELRRLYLVGDYIDSLKFGLLLWLLTYVGAWFNGMTLVILVVVSIFTLPKVYETYQGPIDQNVNLVRAQLNKIMAQVSAKIPFPKKKAKTQ